ncbi:MAG: aldo/keto reductase [Planctomycetaceae bacterium]
MNETLPALRKQVELGKVRYVGVSGYPMKMFKYILENADIDVLLTYNHYTLQNDMALELVPLCQQKGVGLMNAAPVFMGTAHGGSFAGLAQGNSGSSRDGSKSRRTLPGRRQRYRQTGYRIFHRQSDFTTCITGSANPARTTGMGGLG